MGTKKLICAAIAAFLLFSTTACGGGNKTEAVRIGISFRQAADSNTAQYRRLLEGYLQQLGYAPVIVDAQNDAAKQKSQITQLLEQDCRLLIVEPVNAEAVAAWEDPEVPVVFINSEPAGIVLEQWSQVCYVGCSSLQAGAVQGSIIMELPKSGDINGDGAVAYALLQGLSDEKASQLRVEGCLDALETAGVKTHCMAQADTAGDYADAVTQCSQLLSRYGKDIEVIICSGDAVLGAVEAVRKGGWKPGEDIWLVGIGSSTEILEEVRKGALVGTAADDMHENIKQVAAAVQALLNGQSVERQTYIEHMAVTEENVAAFMEE